MREEATAVATRAAEWVEEVQADLVDARARAEAAEADAEAARDAVVRAERALAWVTEEARVARAAAAVADTITDPVENG